jgi:uncharacterized DUF497 family protein
MYMARDVTFRLGELTFVWDSEKHRANVEKHGVTFEEAATTWLDPLAIETFDEDSPAAEDRWFRIGSSLRDALLVTWSTVRTRRGEEVIRMIGARRATRRERRLYEEER